jgi:glycerol-3-phosphate dehydrogenase
MRTIETEVLVIGGGATGTGVIRDLAMRGFRSILVEKRDLTHGTTGRYHGLLHSGGRYVVKDPQAAKECIEENQILRRIMPQCIEDTGGYFVTTQWDDPEYNEQFIEGCSKAGIPTEEITIHQMLREEPLLNPKISHCYQVPDASADSFLAAELNSESARQYGSKILLYHEVLHLLKDKDRVIGAFCHDLVKDEDVKIIADLTINAAGAWAGKIAAAAGIELTILPGKGTMIAVNHRIVNTVINRCKMPSDGDILVPAHTVSVMGTTDTLIEDPDRTSIDPWEIRLMLEEGGKLIPGFREMRILRAWAGVRPLYQDSSTSESRDISRSFVMLDHEERDGVAGLVTITSGKWTTYRKMAEVTVNKACEKLGVDRPCRTHTEPLPDPDHHKYHYLGMRLSKIEGERSYGNLICECELATYEDVQNAIIKGEAETIDDIRRDIRLGMGPCQGGFCTYRAAGILHNLRQPSIEETNVALFDFLQERWKGLLPILWGQQLQQERLTELIYINLLNIESLPGLKSSPLSATNYEQSQFDLETSSHEEKEPKSNKNRIHRRSAGKFKDVVIIGAGLSGLFAGWLLAKDGKSVRIISKGWGATHWTSGCIDILGYLPTVTREHITSPKNVIQSIINGDTDHPYANIYIDQVEEASAEFRSLFTQAGYPIQGSLDHNLLLPSALGAPRPTCLAPETMIAGDMENAEPMLVIGFDGYFDFYPPLIADNVNQFGIPTNHRMLSPKSLKERKMISSMDLAKMFEDGNFREEVVTLIKPYLGSTARVGFPAVLGINQSIQIMTHIEEQLGVPIFEIPCLPPSIPGIRIHKILIDAIRQNGGQVLNGMEVTGAKAQGDRIIEVWSKAAARSIAHQADHFILATGGILGGGLSVSQDGSIKEIVFDLPVVSPGNLQDYLDQEFLSPSGHPIFQSGLHTNNDYMPVDEHGNIYYQNLYAIGNMQSNCDVLRERSLEGVALVTGYTAYQAIMNSAIV